MNIKRKLSENLHLKLLLTAICLLTILFNYDASPYLHAIQFIYMVYFWFNPNILKNGSHIYLIINAFLGLLAFTFMTQGVITKLTSFSTIHLLESIGYCFSCSLYQFMISKYYTVIKKKDLETKKFFESIYMVAEQISNLPSETERASVFRNILYFTGFDEILYFDDSNDFSNSAFNVSLNNYASNLKFDDKTISISIKELKDIYINDIESKGVISIFLKNKLPDKYCLYIPTKNKHKETNGIFVLIGDSKKIKWDFSELRILKLISYSYMSFLDKKSLENVLNKSAKFSALGEIAAGIAHEINNPLAVIHGQSELIKYIVESAEASNTPINPSEINTFNNTLMATVEKVAKIIDGLRFFIKNDEQEPFVQTNIANVLDTVQLLSINRCKKNGILVEIEKDHTLDYLEIDCRPTQIAQVLVNMVNNSFDEITEKNFPMEQRWIKIKLALDSKNNQLHISVIDGGKGIPLSIGEKLLHQFYTTKTHNKSSGSGMGLNISRRIIEAHQGTISIDYNYPNTKFDIYLPIKHPNSI